MKILSRLSDALTNRIYRRVLLTRLLSYLLRRVCPEAHYIGMRKDGETILFFLHDNVITPHSLAMRRSFQEDDIERVLRLCAQHGYARSGLFIDVGANIGTATLAALKSPAMRGALCIEPAPTNLELLRANLAMNHLSAKAQVWPVAVGAEPGKLRLALSAANHGDHRLLGHAEQKLAGRQELEVRVETLDHMVEEAGARADDIALVWVDTQGFDGYVLRGATALIKDGVPFCIEFWPRGMRDAGAFELTLDLIAREFESFHDLQGDDWQRRRPVAELGAVVTRLAGTDHHTDLLLYPKTR